MRWWLSRDIGGGVVRIVDDLGGWWLSYEDDGLVVRIMAEL